jgi:phosphoglucosamine mutase
LDVGFAFDGDADRCIAIDENGAVVNGDHIMYLLGTQLKRNGELVNNTVVTTVMSNLGLYHARDEEGISYVQTKVGDRFVYENMQQTGNCIGGEQSGHIILKKYATTGDGVLTAIKVMETMIDRKLPLSKLASPVQMLPQVMKNLRVADKRAVREDEAVKAAVEQVKAELGDTGRILVRESGTEPVIRVMVEAPTLDVCEACVEQVLQVIRERGLA